MEAACNPGRSNDQNTYVVGSNKSAAIVGVRAYIEGYNPYIAFNSSNAWLQLVHSNIDSWVKTGWAKVNMGVIYWQYRTHVKYPSGSLLINSHGNASLGPDKYQISWQSGTMSVYRNDNFVASYNTYSTTPDLAQAFGEVTSAQNQMPGGSGGTSPVSFTSVQSTGGGAWSNFNGTAFNSAPSWFGLNGISTTAFDVWDKACVT